MKRTRAGLPIVRGFWEGFLRASKEKGKRPVLAMAPMADVTDAALRLTAARMYRESQALLSDLDHPYSDSNAYVTWNEFVPIEGLHHNFKAFEVDLWFEPEHEKPAVAQVFGASPERMRAAAKLLVAQGWDGIDINMGCPDRSVTEKQRAGAALITDAALARDLVAAALEGADGRVPVSVKTRLGYTVDQAEAWTEALLGGGDGAPGAGVAAITFHGRTAKEMSKVDAKWDRIAAAASVARDLRPGIVRLGNGDVLCCQQAEELCHRFDLDGVMMGKALFGFPSLFGCPFVGRRVWEGGQGRAGEGTRAAGIEGNGGGSVKADGHFAVTPEHWHGKCTCREQGSAVEAARALSVSLLSSSSSSGQILGAPSHAEFAKRKLSDLLQHSRAWRDLYEGKGEGVGRNGRPRDAKGFAYMRKHYGVYCRGFPGAARARRLLGETENVSEAIEVAEGLLQEVKDELAEKKEDGYAGDRRIEM